MLRYLTKDYYQETHANVEQEIQRQNLYQVGARECVGLTGEEQTKLADAILTPHHTDLFIEEPESHIFPSTQKNSGGCKVVP